MSKKITLNFINVGDVVPDIHGVKHKITQELYNQLWKYKKQTGKSPIRGGKILGTFLHQKWRIEVKRLKITSKYKCFVKGCNRKPVKKCDYCNNLVCVFHSFHARGTRCFGCGFGGRKLNKKEMDEYGKNLEKQYFDEAQADYKIEFGININPNTKKFKVYYEKWKKKHLFDKKKFKY